MSPATHILIISGSRDDDTNDRRYEIECPGVTDACRMWIACEVPDCNVNREYNHGSRSALGHGVHHMHIDGVWMTPTDQCYVVTLDCMPDAADDLAARERLVNGRYPVDFDYDGEGSYTLELANAEAGAR